MRPYTSYQIKSFKHDGHLHRTWLVNWRIPPEMLEPEYRNMYVFMNCHTRIIEADGKEWTSRVPGIAFFIPQCWYNIVALLEEGGVRYYCNIASPPYLDQAHHTLTYIDYDLDVVVWPSGDTQLLDEHEYEIHRRQYHYSSTVEDKVQSGMNALRAKIASGSPPFGDDQLKAYYRVWRTYFPEVSE